MPVGAGRFIGHLEVIGIAQSPLEQVLSPFGMASNPLPNPLVQQGSRSSNAKRRGIPTVSPTGKTGIGHELIVLWLFRP